MELKQRTNFCQNITYLREINDIRQKTLSNYLGVSLRQMQLIENGEKLPNLDTFVAISEFFGVKMDELINKELM